MGQFPQQFGQPITDFSRLSQALQQNFLKAATEEYVAAYVEAASGLLIPKSIGDAKGDLIGFSAADTPVRIAAAASDGCVLTSDTSQTGGVSWSTRQTSHYASMYVANSGSPTNTGNGAWQKVGSGGGTATYTSEYDVRPNGVSAQVDTTNKYIVIRQAGVYWITATAAFNSISAAKFYGVAIWKSGAQAAQQFQNAGVAQAIVVTLSVPVVCAANDTIELYAITDDSASEAYLTSNTFNNRLTITYLGPST